jgi:two-component system chemotaxis sensor kinase CheA
MSGFDLSELLPYYLDESDEQIGALNDCLLKLEENPSDAPILREAFRLIHSLKGSSTVMGFEQVKHLTHHLETFFDQLRSGHRELDRPTLNLSFRCLDGLRDYHRELRSGSTDNTDLSELTKAVLESLGKSSNAPTPAPKTPAPPTVPISPADSQEITRLVVVFVDKLPWPDMKAKLVLNRVGSKAKIVRSIPAIEQLENIDSLKRLSIDFTSECGLEELRALADVEGVEEILVELDPTSDKDEVVEPIKPAPIIVPEIPATVEPKRSIPEPEPIKAETENTVKAPAQPTKKVAETLRVDVDRLDYMMNLAGELVINRSRFYEIAGGLEELFRDTSTRMLTADTEDRLDRLMHDLELAAEQGGKGQNAIANWVGQCRRLSENFKAIRDQLDHVLKGKERVTALSEAIHQLARITDGLQRTVLETRMVPIGPLFERFHRVIRDLRVSSNKEVQLRIDGEKTELDKRMIDELGDPLIHLVRNSVDHGLESPEQRLAAGKNRVGTVSLQASHRGNSVLITVSDDGRGIDNDRVRNKIVANGLLSMEEAKLLSDRQLQAYIWHPGFSTADKLTDISGRGVGMDIVKSRIENLNGTVDVRSEPGRGTTFTIRLPLTLAIMPCLLVEIAEEVYAIPLDHINEIVEISSDRIFTVQGKQLIEIRDRLVALISLKNVLSWGEERSLAESDDDQVIQKKTVVIARNGDMTIGLVVDNLIGMQEIVLKSIEKNFRSIPSLSGASILGDGRVSLILNIDALISFISSETAVQTVA